MAFDVDHFRQTHRPWEFKVGGRTFLARHVSAQQVLDFQERTKEAGDDRRAHDRALRRLLRLAFPWRFSYLHRGDPVTSIMGLELAARAEALNDFFAALRGGPNLNNPGSRAMVGTISPTPTSTPRP